MIHFSHAIPKTEVNGKALKLSKWKMWYSDILPLQHEVKLADGERNGMVMLLLDYCTTVFLHLSPPISLHPSRPWTLVVGGAAELSLCIDCVVESETRVGGMCGFGFPFTSKAIRKTSVWVGGVSALSGQFPQIAGIHLSSALWSLFPNRFSAFL